MLNMGCIISFISRRIDENWKKTINQELLMNEYNESELLSDPNENNWRFHIKERPQTIERFKLYNKQINTKPTICLIFIENVNNKIKDDISIYYNCNTEIIIYDDFPSKIRKRNEQYLTSDIHDWLISIKNPNNKVTICITDRDLYSNNTYFVFGESIIGDGIGVISSNRLENDYDRLLKLSVHEISHTFGFDHCIFLKCNMNGFISLEELDSISFNLCPICKKKLSYLLNYN